MKKIALFLTAALCSMAMMATEYAGKLTVNVNGEVISEQENVNISIVNNEDGTANLNLNNFVLGNTAEDGIPVGNINLEKVPGVKACGFNAIAINQDLLITEGDLEGVVYWLGPDLQEVPIRLIALYNDTEVRVHIDIDMTETDLGQVIEVDFETPGVDKPASSGVRGDLDGDGKVDVSDVNHVINIILDLE
ncbi:MAG: calycin-like domain-containing protein [Muribaculaceae bacterium]|nr:calycin-like domain-containing protein [Muribaculaceae bacterium]